MNKIDLWRLRAALKHFNSIAVKASVLGGWFIPKMTRQEAGHE